VIGKEVGIFDVSGQIHHWTPEFHVCMVFAFAPAEILIIELVVQIRLGELQEVVQMHREELCQNKPCYLSDPTSSLIRVMNYAEYKAMNAKEVQSVLRDQHIVITAFPMQLIVPTDAVNFDEAGLQLLKNLKAPIIFQGKFESRDHR